MEKTYFVAEEQVVSVSVHSEEQVEGVILDLQE